MTLSGFCRRAQAVYFLLVKQNVSYLHICEGAPDLGEEKIPI
jgi:hypothetical protein